jgi:glutamyl-tRNA synthetase
VTEAERVVLLKAAPLVQERMQLLGEAPGMLGFLFTDAASLTYEDDALATLTDVAPAVLQASIASLEPLETWQTAEIEEALRAALIENLGLKPRNAFGALRVAASGRRVSPPLFESFEILGKQETLARLAKLDAHLAG